MAEGNTTRRTAQNGGRSRTQASARAQGGARSSSGVRSSAPSSGRKSAAAGSADRSRSAKAGSGSTGTRQSRSSASYGRSASSAARGRAYSHGGNQAASARSREHSRSYRDADYDPRIPTRGARPHAAAEEEDLVKRDVVVILLFAAMVFLFLSNFGILGPVGNFFSHLMFGLCGFTAYVLPVLVFFLVLFYYANRDNERIAVKIGAAVSLFLVFGIICEMASGRIGQAAGYDIADLYLNCVAHRNGGGVIAGSLAYLFVSLFKNFGTVLILIIVSVISIVLLTQRSLIDFVGDTTAAAKERHEEKMRELAEEARYAAAENERYNFRTGGRVKPDEEDEVPWREDPDEDADSWGEDSSGSTTAQAPYEQEQGAGEERNPYPGEYQTEQDYDGSGDPSGEEDAQREAEDDRPGILDSLISRLTQSSQNRSRERLERETLREQQRQEKAHRREEERMQRAQEERLQREARENDRILQGGTTAPDRRDAAPKAPRKEKVFRGVRNTVLTDDPVLAQQKARELARVMPGAAGAVQEGGTDSAAGAQSAGADLLNRGPQAESEDRQNNGTQTAGSGDQNRAAHNAGMGDRNVGAEGVVTGPDSASGISSADGLIADRNRSAVDESESVASLHQHELSSGRRSVQTVPGENSADKEQRGRAVLSEDLHEIRPEDYDSVLTLQPDLEALHAQTQEASEDSGMAPIRSDEAILGLDEGDAGYDSDAFSSKVISQGIGSAIDQDLLHTASGIVSHPAESEDLHSISPEDYALPENQTYGLTGSGDTSRDTAVPANAMTAAAAAAQDGQNMPAAPAGEDAENLPSTGGSAREDESADSDSHTVDYSSIPLLHFEDDEVIPPVPEDSPVPEEPETQAIPQEPETQFIPHNDGDESASEEEHSSVDGQDDISAQNVNGQAGSDVQKGVPQDSAKSHTPTDPLNETDQDESRNMVDHDIAVHAAPGIERDAEDDLTVRPADSGEESKDMSEDSSEDEEAQELREDKSSSPAGTGTAPAAEEAEAAKDIAVHKEGVTDIANDIVAAKTTDEVLRSKAEDAPERATAGTGQPIASSGARFTDLSAMNRALAGSNAPGGGHEQQTQRTWQPQRYIYPPMDLLEKGPEVDNADSANELRETAMKLQNTLKTFGVNVRITDISQGPAVTRYEMQPEQGVKVSKIVSLQDDIKLALAATDIRIEAPIPGKSAVGIEVPNKTTNMVALRDILDTPEFRNAKSKTAFGVGKDIAGKTVIADIAKMPHLLIAGATGSGKSVCINTIIMSILYHATPDEVKLIMIDPKVVELSVYNGIPHLLLPVVTDSQKAAATLNWCVAEMEQRFHRFADASVRDIKGYNALVKQKEAAGEQDPAFHFMPHIVIIVDELADLMMVAKNEVETAICRLAQLARAAGMHLIIATQRPSVDVITGLIKANMPSRIAFAVTQGVDSRTILDMNGAEKLLGKGDMLFFPQGLPKPQRIQGAFVSDDEVTRVVNFLKKNDPPKEDAATMQAKLESIANGDQNGENSGSGSSGQAAQDEGPQIDELFEKAGKFIIEKNSASIGLLQRMFRIGFNRAARIMDQLCDAGVVSESEGTKPRKILMTEAEFEEYLQENR